MTTDKWKQTNLGEQVDLLTGFPFKSAKYVEDINGIPLVRGDNVVQGMFRWDDVKRWSKDQVEKVSEYFLKPDDIVLAMDRPWIEAGLKYACVSKYDIPCLLVQRVSRLRAKGTLNQKFLRYVIGSPEFTNYILGTQTGTAVPHISGNQIKQYQFLLPTPTEQRAIAGILGALDDKIELNRRMNRTLESMAQAVFRQWFVESDAVARWEVGKLSGICTTQYGFTASASDKPIGPKLLRITDMNKEPWIVWGDVPYCEISEIELEKYKLSLGDILVSRIADPGKAGIVEEEINAVFASYLVRLKLKDLAWSYFAYYFLCSEQYLDYANGAKSGSVQSGMNARVITDVNLSIPPDEKVLAFYEIIKPLRSKIVLNLKESHTLSRLRDRLLPKFMKGQVKVV